MPVHSRRTSRTLAAAATFAACLAAAAIPATPALGDDDTRSSSPRAKTIHVRGQLTLLDEKTGAYAATGDLDGTWTIPPPPPAGNYYNTETTIIQKGTEFFDGCLTAPRKRCGKLNSEYISWTYLTKDKRLISGGCTHAPTGGVEAFVGVRGLIQMTDSPAGTPLGSKVVTLYEGDVILNAVPEEGPKPIPSTRIAAASAKAAAGFC